MTRRIIITPVLVLSLLLMACESLIEIAPPRNELTTETVFSDDITANAAMVGIYSFLANPSNYMSSYSGGLRVLTSQSSDEYNSFSGSSHAAFFENEVTPDNDYVSKIWSDTYHIVYGINAILEGLETTPISKTLKQQLEGESRFLRAFSYFYLTNLFGDIPLIIDTDYRINRIASRTNVEEVYQFIETDLRKAQELLASDYSFSAGERVRANQAAATALLARTYLYRENWVEAEVEATNVINNTSYQLLTDLNAVFLGNSREAIWQLLPVATRNNAPEAFAPLLPTFGSFTNHMANAFELNDRRKSSWTTTVGAYVYARKYKATASTPPYREYSTVLRLVEQYLIRAEARAQQGNITGSKEDINMVRTRAGLPETPANTQEELLNAIEHERRTELFTEYGHRWFDLKRWRKTDKVLGAIKSYWDPTDVLYPIPQDELLKGPNLTQNLGY